MQKAIIKGGESLSSAISLWNTRHFALDIPEDFTGTSITFQGGGADAPAQAAPFPVERTCPSEFC